MKKSLFFAALIMSLVVYAQANAVYQTRVDQVSQANLQTYDTDLVNFGVRKTGTTIANNAVTYLQNKFLSFEFCIYF